MVKIENGKYIMSKKELVCQKCNGGRMVWDARCKSWICLTIECGNSKKPSITTAQVLSADSMPEELFSWWIRVDDMINGSYIEWYPTDDWDENCGDHCEKMLEISRWCYEEGYDPDVSGECLIYVSW